MKIEVNDNIRWFLESLINEGFSLFYIHNETGVIFFGSGKIFNPDVNFLTSEIFKACPELEKNTEYSIEDFLNGKIDNQVFEFGDKVIVTSNGKEYNCIYLKPKGNHHVVMTEQLMTTCVPKRLIKLAKKG